MKLRNGERDHLVQGVRKDLFGEVTFELRSENEEELMLSGVEVGVRSGKILPVI